MERGQTCVHHLQLYKYMQGREGSAEFQSFDCCNEEFLEPAQTQLVPSERNGACGYYGDWGGWRDLNTMEIVESLIQYVLMGLESSHHRYHTAIDTMGTAELLLLSRLENSYCGNLREIGNTEQKELCLP